MAYVWSDERFVQHQRGSLETCVDVAVRPFVGGFAHREAALLGFREVLIGPFEFRDGGRLRTRRGRPDVAVGSRIWPAGPQGIEGINHKREWFEIDSNSRS